MPRQKSAPRSMSRKAEKNNESRSSRSRGRELTTSSESDEEGEDASQRNRRSLSSTSSLSPRSTASGTTRRSRSVDLRRDPRTSRSQSRQLTPFSDEEEEDAFRRDRRSRSITSSSNSTEPVASSSQRRSLSADPPLRPTSKNVPRSKKGKQRVAPFLKDILKLQLTWNMLIPRAAFGRLVRELFDYRYRITPQALEAMHESTELFMVQLFEDAYKCCLHRARITLSPKDVELVILLRRGIK